ncbi:hypothetical protein ETW23_17535 [Leisingera sp. NJS201]|nr:hypothetical protein ETW23_17535 [Leisingera sp. NJS201]
MASATTSGNTRHRNMSRPVRTCCWMSRCKQRVCRHWRGHGMRISIADWDPRPQARAAQADALADHAAAEQSDLVLLPEMPLSAWLAISPERDAALWEQSVHDHESGLDELGEQLGTGLAGSRPVLNAGGQPRNRAFLWQNSRFAAVQHEKAALPEEDGYWESRWYGAGAQQPAPLDWNGLRIGFAICTELWDPAHGCRLSQAGAEVLLVPAQARIWAAISGSPAPAPWRCGPAVMSCLRILPIRQEVLLLRGFPWRWIRTAKFSR